MGRFVFALKFNLFLNSKTSSVSFRKSIKYHDYDREIYDKKDSKYFFHKFKISYQKEFQSDI